MLRPISPSPITATELPLSLVMLMPAASFFIR